MSFVNASCLQIYHAARWKECHNHSRFIYVVRRFEKLHFAIPVRTFYGL